MTPYEKLLPPMLGLCLAAFASILAAEETGSKKGHSGMA